MEFISTKDMRFENAPTGHVLVQYLSPSWGGWSVEYAIGYFDNPLDYEDKDDSQCGWKLWSNGNSINVIAYAELPKPLASEFTKITQKDFLSRFGSFHPNFGCLGE